jgi:diaminopropionate ammonia-lyase
MDAQIVRVDGSYEDSVGAAIAAARDNGWLLLADGSWDGYTERPDLVMEGYTVLAEECRVQFHAKGIWPSHVFLQAGVGGLAAAVAGHIRQYWDQQPNIIIVEPEAAACLMESIRAHQITRVEGPVSNMGRLDCKDASLIAFGSLKNDADFFVTISDDEAALAVSVLARYSINTTPSGAASFAALPRTNLHSANLNLDEESRCLVFVTEGPEEG